MQKIKTNHIGYLKIFFIFLGLLSATASLAEYLKIIDPRDQKTNLILTNYSCPFATDAGLMEFGGALSKDTMDSKIMGCYKLNDQDRSITFYFSNRQIKPVIASYANIAIVEIPKEDANLQLSFQNRESRLIAEKTQRSELLNLFTKPPTSKADIKESAQKLAPVTRPGLETSAVSTKLSTPKATGKVVGMAFDSKAGANIVLYDSKCNLSTYTAEYPLRWDARKNGESKPIGEGCYSTNNDSRQVFMVSSSSKLASLPMAAFQNNAPNSDLAPNQTVFKLNPITQTLQD
jgi:hypothetical protein